MRPPSNSPFPSGPALHTPGSLDLARTTGAIRLWDGDGYQLMAQVRLIQPALQGIALSGYGREEDVRRSLTNGFSHHLVKPVSSSALEQALHRLAPAVVTT